ncbi:MAG: dihydroorotate dehydrogenase-like protein [Candidatus Azobacteroides sp.]|nr:dihydroorotate dehydrogenase-like protein [Candidatus Azobacteroides sp.]
MTNLLETKFAGLNLPNPIIIASSGLTGTPEKNKELEKAGAGAIILQSIYEEQIEIQTNQPAQTFSSETDETNRNIKKSIQIADYLQLIQETKKRCHIPVIASVICHKAGNWINFVRQVEMAGADAIELNIFALSTENKGYTNFLERIYLQITEKVKALISIPIIVKISKYFSHIVQLATDLQAAGANGLVLFNRFYQPDIDIHRLQIHSGDVFSSSTDIADTLRWTPIVSSKHPDLSLASCTGIHDWEGIIKCILSGASAAEICSTVYLHGNEIISVMKRGIEEWMNLMNFRSVGEFKGKLNTACLADPSLHERNQFRKYFSDRDTE